MNKIFTKNTQDNLSWEKYFYYSQPKRDFFYQARKNLIKNYVLDPDIKLIK